LSWAPFVARPLMISLMRLAAVWAICSAGHIYSGGLRSIGAILCCCNETPTISQITDDLGVIRCVNDGSRLGSQSSDICELVRFRILRSVGRKVFTVMWLASLPVRISSRHILKIVLIDRLEEIFRVDQSGDCGKRLVVY